MSSSSAHSSPSSHSSSSSHSSHFYTLPLHENTLPRKDTLLQPEDNLPQPKDSLLQPEYILKEPEDTVLQSENILLQHDDSVLPEYSTPPDPDFEYCTMPPWNRSAERNVHIFDTSDRNTPIGGLRINNGITNANLFDMIEIFVFFASEYILRNESDITIEKDDSPLQPGNYYIDSPSTSLLNYSFT